MTSLWFQLPLSDTMEQEQLTEVRGFAAQEVGDVEASTLEKLEELKQEYEVEVEQLASDLVVGLFSSPSPPPGFWFSDFFLCLHFYFYFYFFFRF